ncbi:MAG: hypothetical protein Q4G26_16815 [Paracoccus sp. (in: a-proteobacteria)]|nr:hypothetical protein [Paracoccus sp. (in: a-proteobacteria)]
MKNSNETITLEAANDNPGGATSATISMASLVKVMARAYVAQNQRKAGAA